MRFLLVVLLILCCVSCRHTVPTKHAQTNKVIFLRNYVQNECQKARELSETARKERLND